MRVLRLYALAALIVGLACSSDDGGSNPPVPTSIIINAGNTQVGPAGQALATQLAVVVRDAGNIPMAGVNVTWAAATGGGSVNPTTSSTNASGIASTTRTLGANAGAHTTTATVSGLTPVTFNAVAQIQGATQIALSTGNNQSDTVLSTLGEPLAVVVRDQSNAPVAGVVVNWTATGGGSVSAATNTTNANGIATISRTFGIAAGAQGAQAAVTGLVGSPVLFTLTATAGNAVTLAKLSGDGGTWPVGTMLGMSVITRDAYNNVRSGVTIDWAVGTGGGSVTPAQSVTAANGIAGTQRNMSLNEGSHTTTATATALAGSPVVTFSATVVNARNVTVGGANNAFSPPNVGLAVNGTVTWNWSGTNTLPHNVTFAAVAGAPSNIPDQITGSTSRTFAAAGTFNYSCTNHLGMNGSVLVLTP